MIMNEKREIRNTNYQVTIDEEKRMVEGYAALFDVVSDGLPFRETIGRGSFEGVLPKSDVFALLNHDQSRGILARWKGQPITLYLEIDSTGFRYTFVAPKTSLGDELLEYIRRGEVTESSFAFTVEKDEWRKGEDGIWERTIKQFGEIFDISPVYNAAYSQTSVCMRGKEQAEEELKQQEEREAAQRLDTYYENINNSFNI